jgi:ribosomal protein S18 acetylase RimI-like enzyme
MKSLIEDNIYDFYDALGTSMSDGHLKTECISWLKSESGSWPNMIYNTNVQENNLNDFVSKNISAIKCKKAPPFWLVYNDSEGNRLSNKLKTEGMREVFHWSGMGLNITAPIESESIQIKLVENDTELNDWLSVVNVALMTSNKIPFPIFSKLYTQPNFNLYLVYLNNIPVSTGLAFFSDNYCGIYMIATLSEYRNKGLGSAVTKQCINDALQKGIHNIVLQASPSGESIYQKMGFKKYCEFSIYWMLGKEFK